MNIRSELHPIQNGEKFEVPTACYTLSPEDKHKLCLFLKNLKVLDGFSSNIFQCVNIKDHKISGLKSHDCHVLLQHLLPLALRGMLSKEVCGPLVELSIFFSVLGSKELKIDNLEHIEAQIPITLCKAFPEGSIAKGYIAIECMTLCSRKTLGAKTLYGLKQMNYNKHIFIY
ncbi:hypothetical protein RDI58_010569 [Solanum bulbocastanum]|uniref:Uncharacterized protein n=1 Tax=Solanum bulbocastanum TaxID=147425 RepID=A0AAN8YJL6_SOLBU